MNESSPAIAHGAQEVIIPVSRVAPCRTLSSEPFHLVAIDGYEDRYFATHALTPPNEHLARNPVYSARVGDTWAKELEDDEIVFYEYLGRYRMVAEIEDPETGESDYLLSACAPKPGEA